MRPNRNPLLYSSIVIGIALLYVGVLATFAMMCLTL